MCGIVGYTGNRAAMPVLISGLKKLEYRGYDSAGIAVTSSEGILIRKQSGKVAGLAELVEQEDGALESAHSGIAHTRWATHGPPTTLNAHPHEGNEGRVVIVHNGIIENHNALRD
ncbi:MAG: glutamine--fructose-6-phosphate aminotransferase, partial [Limisphaerales bacterium]